MRAPRIPERTRRTLIAIATVAAITITASCSGTGDSAATSDTSANASTTVAPPASGPLVSTPAPWKLDKAWSRAVVLDDNGQLLVFSGLDAAKHSLARVVHIDPANGHITENPKLPRVLHDAAGTTLGSTALLIGGGEQESGYDHVTAVTGPHAGQDLGHLPQARSDTAAITVGDTAYVIGGYDGKSLPPSMLATSDGVTFRSVADLNPAVRYPAVATTGAKVYVFGGKTASGQTDDIQRYDPSTATLTTVGHLPTPLGHALAFTLGDTIYIAGGRTGAGTTDTANKVSTQIWSFDPTTNTVNPAGTLPHPVADASVAVINDHAYIIGGETDDADTPTNTVIILNH